MYGYATFSDLIGKTIVSIDGLDSDHVVIKTECGKTYRMQHFQECCESVSLKEVRGNPSSIIGTPIRYANSDTSDCSSIYECGTRTTFTLSTGDDSLILIWEGYSNGYYGEGVSFYEDDGSGSRW